MSRSISGRSALPFGYFYYASILGMVLLQLGFAASWLGIITIRVSRRTGGAPVSQYPELLHWGLPALVIGIVLFAPVFFLAFGRWVRGIRFSLLELLGIVSIPGAWLAWCYVHGMFATQTLATPLLVPYYCFITGDRLQTLTKSFFDPLCTWLTLGFNLLFVFGLLGRIFMQRAWLRIGLAIAMVFAAAGFGYPTLMIVFSVLATATMLINGMADWKTVLKRNGSRQQISKSPKDRIPNIHFARKEDAPAFKKTVSNA